MSASNGGDADASLNFERIVDIARPLELGDGQPGRTCDVTASMASSFDELMLSAPVLAGIKAAGFRRPSPVQVNALPMGKLGLDLVVQAKSGTGKTLVFVVLALETVDVDVMRTQVLIIAPTREIANQIEQTIAAILSRTASKNLKYRSFIGGTPLKSDVEYLKKQRCHIVIGTPGRLRQLCSMDQLLPLDGCRLLVLDEADMLVEGDFQPDVNYLFSMTPSTGKQVAVFSATYPRSLDAFLSGYMQSPTLVRALDAAGDVQLLGVKQYVCKCADEQRPSGDAAQDFVAESKLAALVDLLQRVGFSQAMVFCRTQRIVEDTSNWLLSRRIDSQFISGGRAQVERTQVMKQLRKYNCRLLVSTDLTARGIDAPNVDLVVNLCLPPDTATYFHRIGRAGRFGSYGAAVTLVDSRDLHRLARMNSRGELSKIKWLDCRHAPFDLCNNESFYDKADRCRLPRMQSNGYTTRSSCQDGSSPTRTGLSRLSSESDQECLSRIGDLLKKLDENTSRLECTAADPSNIGYSREEMLACNDRIMDYISAHVGSTPTGGGCEEIVTANGRSSAHGGVNGADGFGGVNGVAESRRRRMDELLSAVSLDDIPLPGDAGGRTPKRRAGGVKFDADPFAPIDDMAFWADADAGRSYPAVNIEELPMPKAEPLDDAVGGPGATVVFYGSPAKPPPDEEAGGFVTPVRSETDLQDVDDHKATPEPVNAAGDGTPTPAAGKQKSKRGRRYNSYFMNSVLKSRPAAWWWAQGDKMYDTSEPPFVPHYRQRATRTVLIARWRRREIDIPEFCWPFFSRDVIQDRQLLDQAGHEPADESAPPCVRLDALPYNDGLMDAMEKDAERFAQTVPPEATVLPDESVAGPLDSVAGARHSASDGALAAARRVCAKLDADKAVRRVTEDLLAFGLVDRLPNLVAPVQPTGAAPPSVSFSSSARDDPLAAGAGVMQLHFGPPGLRPLAYGRDEMLRCWTHATAHGRAEAQWAGRVLVSSLV